MATFPESKPLPASLGDSDAAADSLGSWILLFFLVIFIPTLLLVQQLNRRIGKTLEEGERLAAMNLTSQSQAYAGLFDPSRHFAEFAESLVRVSTFDLRSFARRMKHRFPGAFRWVIWSASGQVLPLPRNLGFPGARLWEKLHREALILPSRTREALVDRQAFATQDFYAFLGRLFGSSLSVDDFLRRREFLHRLELFGQPALMAWNQIPANLIQDARGDPRPQGWVTAILLDQLPRGFWERLFLWKMRKSSPQVCRLFPLALVDLRDPGFVIRTGSLPSRPEFFVRARNAYRNRQGEVFQVGNWLATNLATPNEEDRDHRVLVFSSIRELLEEAERHRLFVWRSSVLFLALSFGGWLMLWRGTSLAVSLRTRMAALFSIAIFLPTSLLILNWQDTDASARNSLDEREMAGMRAAAEALQRRFHDFPRALGRRLDRYLRTRLVTRGEPPASVLEDLMAQKICKDAFLCGEEGKITRVFSSGRGEAADLTLIRITMKSSMAAALGQGASGALLGEALSEEIGRFSGERGKATILSSGDLNRFSVGKGSWYWMFLEVKRVTGSEGIMIRLDSRNLGWIFARRFRDHRSRQVGSTETADVLFAPIENYPRLPRHHPIWENRQVMLALLGSAENAGRTELDGVPCLFFISAASRGRELRPVLVRAMNGLYARLDVDRQVFWRNITVTLIIVLVLGVALAGRLLTPLRRMSRALSQVGAGDLEVRLGMSGTDEIAQLGASFDLMVRGLQERERMTRFLSRSAVASAREGGQDGRVARRTFAVVLFSDIRDFTSLSEQLTPEEVVELLNGYFGVMAAVVDRHGGDIDKYIGDAIMATFQMGEEAGKSPRDLALGALACAWEMRSGLAEFNQRRRHQGLREVDNGIGLNAGEVISGNVGAHGRLDHTLIGDVVNVASRLEGLSKMGRHSRIMVSQVLVELGGDHYSFAPMGLQKVKGKTREVSVFEVVGVRAAPPWPSVPGGGGLPPQGGSNPLNPR